jgi:hypothetical protein
VKAVSSSESNVIDKRWAHHYAEASLRRRKRGWHRREDGRARRGVARWHVYAAIVAAFSVLVVAALLISK